MWRPGARSSAIAAYAFAWHACVRRTARSIWGTSIGDQLLAALPVVGVDGTVARLALHTRAQGHCEAKTGTLDYVTNLAGVPPAK